MTDKKEIKIKIKKFEADFKVAQKKGHVTAINTLSERRGVEICLPTTITKEQAHLIAKYIKETYSFEACFFIKKHNINVYYEA